MLLILFMMLIFTIGLGVILNKKKSILHLQNTAHAYLCMKEYSGIYEQFKKHIRSTNKIILLLNTVKKGSLVIPALGIVTASNSHKLEKMVMASQQIHFVSFLKYLGHLQQKKCTFTPQLFKSPVHYRGLSLERTVNNTVKMRSEMWHVLLLNQKIQLKITHRPQKSTITELLTSRENKLLL
jgi:hypothetical protein